jgi:hypothetical protein
MLHALIFFSVMLLGCSGFGTAQSVEKPCADLRPQTPLVMLNGAHSKLPKSGTRLVVWSTDYMATHHVEPVLIAWLQERGMTVIERAHLDKLFQEQHTRLRNGDDRAELLRVGKIVGAEQIVFASSKDMGASFRAVDVESSEILWSGYAAGYYLPYAELARRAVEAAWGFKPIDK